MIRQQGSTNGFCFSESLIGASAVDNRPYDLSKIAVVGLPSGLSYAVARSAGRHVALRRGALGFWRTKKNDRTRGEGK